MLIWRARVPSTRARSYFVMYSVVTRLTETLSLPVDSSFPSSTSGASSTFPSSSSSSSSSGASL